MKNNKLLELNEVDIVLELILLPICVVLLVKSKHEKAINRKWWKLRFITITTKNI